MAADCNAVKLTSIDNRVNGQTKSIKRPGVLSMLRKPAKKPANPISFEFSSQVWYYQTTAYITPDCSGWKGCAMNAMIKQSVRLVAQVIS